jgi:1,4-dihydroxy-2-naphthoate octaprenyltransferase
LVATAIALSAIFGILYYTSVFNLIFMLAYIPLIKHLKTVYNNENPRDLDAELKKLALATLLLSVLLGVGQLI